MLGVWPVWLSAARVAKSIAAIMSLLSWHGLLSASWVSAPTTPRIEHASQPRLSPCSLHHRKLALPKLAGKHIILALYSQWHVTVAFLSASQRMNHWNNGDMVCNLDVLHQCSDPCYCFPWGKADGQSIAVVYGGSASASESCVLVSIVEVEYAAC